MNTKISLTILLAALIIAGGGFLSKPVVNVTQPLGATAGGDFTNPVKFYEEISLTSGDNNNCTSLSWNPGAVVSSTIATTSVTMPRGYEVGDVLVWGFTTSTSGVNDLAGAVLYVTPTRVASGTEVVASLFASTQQAASLNVGTSTLKVCYFD